MKKMIRVLLVMGAICLVLPQTAPAGKGFMGGKGDMVVEEEPAGDGGMPGTVEGPLNDNMSTSGALFGDLYKILRYQGGETYTKYIFSYDDVGRITDVSDPFPAMAIGGEPVLSDGFGYYAKEVVSGEKVTYELDYAPYPSQCVQPVADSAKWGNINGVTGLEKNRLPLVMSYDTTWTRTECEVGEVIGPKTNDWVSTGTLIIPDCSEEEGVTESCVNRYFIPPCDDLIRNPEKCTLNGKVYCDGVLWSELVDEVHFGRLNLSRAPEAVLQAAFDEAINSINNARLIERDPAGRLLLTTDIYEEVKTSVDDNTCAYSYVETVTKAIDSPLENLALYVKLMQDGHLVTPGDERQPIDRSERGGIPIWKMLELEDGPSDDLRPAVKIYDSDNNLTELAVKYPWLVDVFPETYYTYYECFKDDNGTETATPCMCWNPDPLQPELNGEWVMCEEVISRDLVVVDSVEDCPAIQIDSSTIEYVCDGGPFDGLKTDGVYGPDAADLDFAAAFLAAAAPKYDSIGPDLIVYLNSILGINKVVGYSDYEDDGTPALDAINYSNEPKYFNYSDIKGYDRETLGSRPKPNILVNGGGGYWQEKVVSLTDPTYGVKFENLGVDRATGVPTNLEAKDDFLGFTQMANDNLSTIKLIHDYAPPSAGE